MEIFHWSLHGLLVLSIVLLIVFMLDALTLTWVRRMYEFAYHIFAMVGGQVIAIDMDYLRNINNIYGHAGGNAALRLVAQVFRAKAWPWVFRCGGEEFSILGFRMTQEKALLLAEEIRREVEARELELTRIHDSGVREKVRLTVSIGCGRWEQEADAALYLAKERGRNRVCCEEGLA